MKIKSRLYEVISGSIGDITGAMGLGGAYFKNKPRPSNPQTANQTVVRNALSTANTAWLGLTSGVRAEWEQYGSTCSHTNQTGATVTLTGWNAFSRAFVIMTQAGIPTNSLQARRPENDGYASNPVLDLSKDEADDFLTATNKSGASVQLILYVGAITRSTINNYGGSFNYNVDGVVADNATLKTTKAVASGRNWLRSQAVTNDGQASRGLTQFLDEA